MNIQEALQIIKKSIENTAIAAVKTLRDSTYKVDVGTKPVAVEGKVAVVDWDKLQVELAKISKWQEEVGKSVRAIEVKDQVQVEISPEGFSAVLAALEELSQQVSKLPTKYPEVKIPPFPKIEFPKIPEPLQEVSVKNLEKLVGKDPKRYVPVRLSDGKRFYEALESLTVSASRTQAFSDSQGVKQQALVDEDRHVQVDVLSMPNVELEVKDIQIGAVEIKDGESDTRAVVGDNGLETEVKKSALPKGAATSDKQDDIISVLEKIDYEYMGKQTSGDYTYFGFKENGGTRYKIMRRDTTDASAWAYCYGASGWSTAWTNPAGLSYGDPPDS